MCVCLGSGGGFHLADDLSARFFHKHQFFQPLCQASPFDQKEPSLTDRNIHLAEVLHDSRVIFWEMEAP